MEKHSTDKVLTWGNLPLIKGAVSDVAFKHIHLP